MYILPCFSGFVKESLHNIWSILKIISKKPPVYFPAVNDCMKFTVCEAADGQPSH